ncbi:MAG: VWA-like domain-containing protein, partial [Thermodesulfobacteriota bacterium]
NDEKGLDEMGKQSQRGNTMIKDTINDKINGLTTDVIDWVKVNIMLRHPGIGGLLAGLKAEFNKDIDSIAGTDGYSILWNPEHSLAENITKAELIGITVHEIVHVMYQHVCGWASRAEIIRARERGKKGWWRDGFQRREPYWTIAQELVVNECVVEMFGCTLPKGGFLDRRYYGKTTEAVYYALLKDAPPESNSESPSESKTGKDCSQDDGKTISVGTVGGNIIEVPIDRATIGDILSKHQFDEHISGDRPATREQTEKLRNRIKDMVSKARHAAEAGGRGSLPAGMNLILGELVYPQLPWRELVEPFIREISNGDYTMSVPDRRYLSSGFYLPGLLSHGIRIAVAVDLSGSIGKDARTDFWSEIKLGAMNVCQDYELHLFGCDASIQDGNYQVAKPGEDIDLDSLMSGGGGTDFRPVFNRIEEDDIQIDALFYLTDALGEFPESPPQYPVIWVVKGGGSVPWGARIQMD